jgi:uncharacterized membrane protein YphA (DoxX/SURF4 family)
MSHPVKNAGLLGLRTGIAGVLFAHGCQKAFGWPKLFGGRLVLGQHRVVGMGAR